MKKKFLQEHLHHETEVSKLNYHSRITNNLNQIWKSSKADCTFGHLDISANFLIMIMKRLSKILIQIKLTGMLRLTFQGLLTRICSQSMFQPLEIISNQWINTGSFPLEWKNANVVPFHKKGDKKCLKNYRPVSQLHICGKIFQKLIFDEIFWFFVENKLISLNSRQITPVLTNVFWWQDWNKRCFLDIAKAFYKV